MEKVNRSLRRNVMIATACALLAAPATGAFAQSPAEKTLLAKAQTLAANGHLEMAVQTWQQILMADANNQEALLGIAKADMQLGKSDEAKKYLDRLRASGGNTAAISQIQKMPNVQPQSARLSQAGQLAQQGRYSDAMRIYRDLFGSNPPAGNYALAYYDTEAAIPEDRPHAIEGLRRLVKQFPADSRYAITLGRILTYDPRTRSEGIGILRQYEEVPAAQTALRQAESWDTRAQTAAPVAEQNEHSAPEMKASTGNPIEGAAYRALNSGRLEEARQQFQSLLVNQPNNPRALTGMGYVAMKQQDFASAADYLERARSAGARGLDSAINTAHFWQKMAQAGDALKTGEADTAADSYREALALQPSNADALEGLGGALMQAGAYAEASDAFERAVHLPSSRATAWRGLFLAQSSAGNAQAALDTNDRMPKTLRAELSHDPDYLRTLAQDNVATGRKEEADRVVEQALSLPFPNEGRDLPAEKQMQYAALLMTARKYEPAIRLYRQVVAQNPDNTGAWRALIAAQHQLGEDNDALATLGRLPHATFDRVQSDSSFLVLIGSIYQSRQEWSRAQIYLERALSLGPAARSDISLQLADVYAAQHNTQKAYTIYRHELDQHPENQPAWRGLLNTLHQSNHDREALRQITSMPESVRLHLEQDPGYLQVLASIQSATGQTQASLRTFAQLSQAYAAKNIDEPADVQIQYGWALLNAGDNPRLYALVSNLSNVPDLNDDQQSNFQRLWASWSVQRATAALTAGDQQRAVAILEAAAQAFPRNPDVYSALAGVYLKAGQPKQAVAIYSSLDMDHASLPQYRGAIGAALAARDMKHAETWLEAALDRYKNDPAILKMAAQYEQARGNNERAAAYYRAALDAMGPATDGDILSQPGLPQTGPSPAQHLMQLLAPGGRTARMQEPADMETGEHPIDVSWQDSPGSNVPTLGDFARTGYDSATHGEGIATGKQESTLAQYALTDDTQDQQLESLSGNAATLPASHGSRLQRSVSSLNAKPSSALLERDTVVSSVEYLKPASATIIASRPLSQSKSQDKVFQQDDLMTDPDPASRLQSAVRDMNKVTQQDPESPATLPALPNNRFNTSESAAPRTSAILPPLTGPTIRVERPKTEREQVEEQLAILQGASSGWIGGASMVDYRSGQPGYDRLAIYSGQVEGSGTLGPNLRTTIITRPVLLDSGQATGAETFQQGTLPAGSIPYVQSAAGIGGEFQLRASAFAASIGYTPHGFLIENVTGGLLVHPPASHFTLTFSRDPILDTQLSYAGLRDLGSKSPSYIGNVWGGVIANAGQLQLAFGDNLAGWYIQGGGQYITGNHVQDNRRLDGDAGAYWEIWHRPEYGNLTLGMNFFGMHYDHNLRYFTYGQGGYFSPAAYMLAGIPFTFNGHQGARFHYRVSGSLGVQAFQEDSAPYYPLDPGLQTASNDPYYPEHSSVGGNYSLETEGAYAIADHWYVGGYLNFNNARDYASNKAGFFLRYLIRPQPAREETGPTGIFPLLGFRPLQVP